MLRISAPYGIQALSAPPCFHGAGGGGRRAEQVGWEGTAPCTHPQSLAELLRHVQRRKQNIILLYNRSRNISDFVCRGMLMVGSAWTQVSRAAQPPLSEEQLWNKCQE